MFCGEGTEGVVLFLTCHLHKYITLGVQMIGEGGIGCHIALSADKHAQLQVHQVTTIYIMWGEAQT